VEHRTLSDEAQLARHQNPLPPSIGLESSEETLKYIWESGVVAVAGDMPSLEAWPWQNREFFLHEWLLAGWGCPIGEYFDLDQLGEKCAEAGRWSLFFSSVPLNVSFSRFSGNS
jgi:kynurenine formamidase